jgi:hypothetical protein
MKHDVDANWDILFKQSKTSIEEYFLYAKKILEMGEVEYKASDVIALANIMAYDLRTTSILVASQNIRDAILAVSQTMLMKASEK